ncbi:MAG: sialidase family protein [Armatimonadota bacterium]
MRDLIVTLPSVEITMLLCLLLLALSVGSAGAADQVTWLLEYQGDELPSPDVWSYQGQGGSVRIEDGALRIVDEADEGVCNYRATFEQPADTDIVVEARVKVNDVSGVQSMGRLRPIYSGGPVAVRVGDGSREEGLVLVPGRLTSFLDRMHMMDTTGDFHTYRLEINGRDMSIFVDGERVIEGRDAFWQPSEAAEPFVTFGSTCEPYFGDSSWEFIRLGVRPHVEREVETQLRITMSEPWEIPQGDLPRMTRPYLYNVGGGRLMLSVAQGPDAIFEPYGVLTSTDEGRTWTPIEGLQDKTLAPQPMIRMADGSIFGASRWTVRYTTPSLHRLGTYVGVSYRFDPDAQSFEMYESRIHTPEEILAEGNTTMVFDRDIFRLEDDTLLAVTYNSYAGYLLRSTDRGRTWEYVSTIGERHEPGVEFLSDTEMTAVLRQGTMHPLEQVWSEDAGQTWSEQTVLEFGSVDPDVVLMSNGVLACSYGRPGSCIAFSTDRGRTWSHHRVVTPDSGFNYNAIREVSPGRLLYIHDAPPLTCLHIDVEVVQ